MNEPKKKDGYRVIIASDIHHIHNKTWYNYSSYDRMPYWAEAIKKEHERHPIDLILIAGDVSLDHYLMRGAYTAEGISDTEEFMNKFMPLLPSGIPVFVGAGNHELYNNEQWKAYTGNERQGYMVLEHDLFIIFDTFASPLEPNYDGSLAAYTPVDVDYAKEIMAKYPNHRVWLVAHYFEFTRESDAFKELVKDPRVIGLFAGHTHQSHLLHMGEAYGNKVVAQTGNFSYSYYTPFPTDDINDLYNAFWGFRELIIHEDSAESNYIVVDNHDVATVNGEILQLDRRLAHSIEYKY